jgi:hypothetical protein
LVVIEGFLGSTVRDVTASAASGKRRKRATSSNDVTASTQSDFSNIGNTTTVDWAVDNSTLVSVAPAAKSK